MKIHRTPILEKHLQCYTAVHQSHYSVQSIAKIVIQFEVLTERNIEKQGIYSNSNFKRRKAGWQVRVKVKMPWDKKII